MRNGLGARGIILDCMRGITRRVFLLGRKVDYVRTRVSSADTRCRTKPMKGVKLIQLLRIYLVTIHPFNPRSAA